MMHDTTRPETSAAPADDGELEQWLRDAYDAPPVPRTLLRRLDRVVAEEWGRPPQLADHPAARLQRSLARGAGWLRAAPVAAGVVLVIAAVLFFGKGSPAYAWTAMVRALEQQGLVQLEGPDLTRWLSLADGVMGERFGDNSSLLDVRQHVLLERRGDETAIRRRTLSFVSQDTDRNRLVLAFLLGRPGLGLSAERVRGARLTDERWERVNHANRDAILLHVRFETASAERIELALTLDPLTRLPIACDVQNGDAAQASLAVSYPAISVSELRAKNFPTTATVVEVDETGVQIAGAASTTAAASASETTVSNAAAVRPNQQSPSPVENPPALPLAGAASKWRPVAVVDRSREEVLREIDARLSELWAEHHVEPAPPADDEELLRRVYLDLTGRTPSVHEVRTYLKDQSPDRYAQLVDRLLQSPDHASHMAVVWRTFLIPEGVDLTAFGGVEAFDRWLAERFGGNEPYDQVVRNLLLAEGRLSRSGPLLFYSATKLDPDQLASRTARVFLGMRLECAQCHNHPFEPWTQQDFWSFAAFFAQISRPQGELQAVSTVMQVRDVNRGEVKLPDTDTIVPPRFLNGGEIQSDNGAEARRQQLARWLTSAANPYFARATANRVWGILFGKGIVDPLDDFGVQHVPKSPELLDLLAGHFIHNKFDLRELFRTVALSRAYRLSSGAETADVSRADWFAQMPVKTLTAEQVYDCITVATLLDGASAGDPSGFNVNRFGNAARDEFLQQFRTPTGRSTEYLGGIPQALTLMNGTLIDGATGLSSSGLLKSLEAPFFTNEQRIEVLYFATLSRRPRPAEWDVLHRYIRNDASGIELHEGLADLLWALLNSAEFTMNH